MDTREEKIDKLCRLTLICTLISFAGWIFEKIGRWIAFSDAGDRGFLTLPLCPIYGISVTAVFLLCGTPTFLRGFVGGKIRKSRLWKRTVKNKAWRKYAFYFIFVTLLSSTAELLVGLASRAVGLTLWDYSDRAFNLFGVVCLSFSLMWGVLITLFMGFIWKPMYTLIHKIPKRSARQMAFVIGVAVGADFCVNAILTAALLF